MSYYPGTDSLYISLSERPGADVVVVAEGFVVDVDEEGRPVGIDIDANASSIADLSRLELEGLSLEGITAGPLTAADGGTEGEAAGTSAPEDLSVFTVTYTPTKDGRWKAQCTELPAAVMHAEKLEKARDAILTAVSMLIGVRREKAESSRAARKKGAVRERLVPQPESEPAYPELHELPREVAFWILTEKRGYTANHAREIIAMARGEWEGDVQTETEAETKAAVEAETESAS